MRTLRISLASFFLVCAVSHSGTVAGQEQGDRDPQGPRRAPQPARQAIEPSHADVSYGPHERNVIDLYLAESDRPTPLVLYIHGGGFRGGDKRSVNPGELQEYLGYGYSVAAINYRLTNVAPAPAAYMDCARALQFLRHHASKWNLDPRRVASTGGSAGAGTSLWLAFHDDLADADSGDPISRQSTRLTCVAVKEAQCSYSPLFAEKVGIPRPNFDRHDFFLPFYDLTPDQIDTPAAYAKYKKMAPITYLTADDPPAFISYGRPNVPVTAESDLGLVVHHPLLGIALKKEMDRLGIRCTVQYRDEAGTRTIRHGESEPPTGPVAFIRSCFDPGASAATSVASDADIDWAKARELRQKQRTGAKLTAEEQAYVNRAVEARARRRQPAPNDTN